MASLAKIGRMSVAVSSFILPAAKLAAGLWFLHSSAKLVWKCVKPIRDHIRKRNARFSSGRVQKFYKFTPHRVKRREERKKKLEARKTCRNTLFVADIVEEEDEEEEIPPSEQEIDIKLLISQRFSLCQSQCCSAFAHVEDEGKVQVEVADMGVSGIKNPVSDEETTEPHCHASTSPIYEGPCMTSTPYVSTIPVYGLTSLGEEISTCDDMFATKRLCMFSSIKDEVTCEGLASVQSDSNDVTEIENFKTVIQEIDCSDDIAIDELFKSFLETTEDLPGPSNECIKDVKTKSVHEEGEAVKTEKE